MEVDETTQLTAFWGIGVMASMLLSGTVLIKWLGYMRIMRIGIVASALVFIGVIVSGAMGNPGLFRSLVLVMGLGTGLAGAGMLTGVINFTTVIRAGMLMGVWGVANMTGHAFGSLIGGAVVDLMRSLTGNAFIAYATVFAIEVVFLLTALFLSTRLAVGKSRVYAEENVELPLVTAD
jgi:BCD family chlorophyll transporter-like MFS transporter